MITPIYIDPFHDILRGSTVEYATEETRNGSGKTTITRITTGGDTDIEEGTTAYGPPTPAVAVLRAPKDVVVKSRSIRTTVDGRQVVDLVLTVENIPGAERYEVRVSKE